MALTRVGVKNAVKGAKMHLKTKDVASFAIKNQEELKKKRLWWKGEELFDGCDDEARMK